MNLRIVLVAAVIGLLFGAAGPTSAREWVRSSIKYTQGTKALSNGDYAQAAELLAEAVSLDPTLSRNHGNYAAALYELQRYQEGWPHVRKAVLLDPRNREAQQNNRRYIVRLLGDAHLNTGATLQQVVSVLGDPDNISERGECVWYQYGISALCFKQDVFSEIGDARWRRRR